MFYVCTEKKKKNIMPSYHNAPKMQEPKAIIQWDTPGRIVLPKMWLIAHVPYAKLITLISFTLAVSLTIYPHFTDVEQMNIQSRLNSAPHQTKESMSLKSE